MKRGVSPIAWTLLLLVAGSLNGQVPVGSEFQVSDLLNGCQTQPKIAADAQGNFVVVWSSYYTTYDGFSYMTDADIHGKRFDSSATIRGSEFVVNTYTTGNQTVPSIASTPAGSFVVVWQASNQDESSDGVFGRRFSSTGGALGSEFRVNSYTTGSQARPSVAGDGVGNFVVVWHSLQDGYGFGIFGQRFASAGAAVGTEFRVNAYTTSSQTRPSIAANPAGSFVVAWRSRDVDGDDYGIVGRRFSNAGVPVGTEFLVNSYTTNAQETPSVSMATAGDFVVVWRSYEQEAPGNYHGIFGQRFASTGEEIGTEFQVNTYTSYDQDEPSVSAEPGGDFVVVWHSLSQQESLSQDGSGAGVFGQRFASDGTALGSEFQINTYTTANQGLAAVVARAAEDFVVVWASSASGIFGQRFGSDLIFEDGFESGDSTAWRSGIRVVATRS
ncbi:MAG: hypothetical protein ACREQQ_09535 [Candidatus Binatia bacterium]